MDLVEPVLRGGEDVLDHDHSLLAVVELRDVRLQVHRTAFFLTYLFKIS